MRYIPGRPFSSSDAPLPVSPDVSFAIQRILQVERRLDRIEITLDLILADLAVLKRRHRDRLRDAKSAQERRNKERLRKMLVGPK